MRDDVLRFEHLSEEAAVSEMARKAIAGRVSWCLHCFSVVVAVGGESRASGGHERLLSFASGLLASGPGSVGFSAALSSTLGWRNSRAAGADVRWVSETSARTALLTEPHGRALQEKIPSEGRPKGKLTGSPGDCSREEEVVCRCGFEAMVDPSLVPSTVLSSRLPSRHNGSPSYVD